MSEDEEPEPYALTEQHVAALERANRAKGSTILAAEKSAATRGWLWGGAGALVAE